MNPSPLSIPAMTPTARRPWLLALGLPVIVHGAWGYPVIDLMRYTTGCLMGLVLAVALRMVLAR